MSATVAFKIESEASDLDMLQDAQQEQDEDMERDGMEEEQGHDMRVEERDEPAEVSEEISTQFDLVSKRSEHRIVIAIDFGTTFSSVAYSVLPAGASPDQISLDHVQCIGNYPGYEPVPGVPVVNRFDVPTELWYDDGSTKRSRLQTLHDDHLDHLEDDGQSDSTISDDDSTELDSIHSEEDGIASGQSSSTPTAPATQFWGYEVQQRLNIIDIHRDDARPLTRFKLNLGHRTETAEAPKTQHLKTEMRSTLKSLLRKKIIQNEADIYTDYLTHLLKHTKTQLLLSNSLRPNMLFQFVLCVPAKWPTSACRTMQTALEKAVVAVEMREHANQGPLDIFMISEPEAAAECILAETNKEILPSETIVIVDAGGGTVDAVTYTCTNRDPVRLCEERVAPDSRMCGASFINEKYEQELVKRLARETYLETNGKTLKSIAQAQTSLFENHEKRRIDTRKLNGGSFIRIDNLRENRRRGFDPNVMMMEPRCFRKFFEESLAGVMEVLESQLELAESSNCRVLKVILTGGFGQSPSLQSYLRKYLQSRAASGREIELIVPASPSTAVARGAVLRALNKRFGPSRITQSSYGFLQSEQYEPDVVEAHKKTICRVDKVDGVKYVDGTIRWVIQAGDRVGNMQVFRFDVFHTFPESREKLVCEEELWMSDRAHKNHYRKTHSENKGAMLIGKIETDVTFLVQEGKIEPQYPQKYSTHAGSEKKHWEVYYELVMTVEGRSIRFEAKWPARRHLKPGHEQTDLCATLVGIAAAFPPGTA